ncbi:MAG: ribosome silencing factor [Dysgonamonadaceae bacterium]|jgi:ribosome-associated protein|nr:ribosome silencing factor [Dysgonamonadaceae bacterium]
MSNETDLLLTKIIEGLQEKKGRRISTIDLSGINGSICRYFVICDGNSPTQVAALSDSVWDVVGDQLHEKPLGVIGKRESQWIAMDYNTVIVHIFMPELRTYYNLENLWADAPITNIPEL